MRTITFSAYASAAGSIGQIDMDTAAVRMQQLDVQSEVQKMNGDVASAESNLVLTSGQKQATATRASGWGSIGAAATGVGTEVFAGGYELAPDKEINANQTKVTKLDTFKDSLEKVQPADIHLTNKTPAQKAQDLAASHKKLNEASKLAEKNPSEFEDHIAQVKATQNQSRSEKDCLDKFSDKIENEQKKYQSAIDSKSTKVDRRATNMRSYGRAGTDLSRGLGSYYSAAAQNDQATVDAVKKQADFADSSAQAAVKAIGDSVSSASQQQQGLNDLVNGLIRANTIN